MFFFRCCFDASRKTHRQTVSASAVNLLRQKRKKRTLAETLPGAISPAVLAEIKSPAYPRHYRDTSEVKSRYFSPAMPPLSPALGGTWLQAVYVIRNDK